MRNASVSDTLCDLDHHDLLDFLALSTKVRRKPFDAASEWHQIAPPYSSARVVASACKGQESDRRRRELKVACGGAFTDKYGKRISASQFESFPFNSTRVPCNLIGRSV